MKYYNKIKKIEREINEYITDLVSKKKGKELNCLGLNIYISYNWPDDHKLYSIHVNRLGIHYTFIDEYGDEIGLDDLTLEHYGKIADGLIKAFGKKKKNKTTKNETPAN